MPRPRTTSDDQGTCYRRADTGRCADAPDVAPPRGQKSVDVRAIGPLNMRRDEDMKSPVIATIKAGQCLALEACRDTQWGVRCRIHVDHNGNKGYVVKYYSKDGRDYIAFVNRR